MSPTLSVKCKLIPVLRSQVFEYLREKQNRRAFEFLEPPRSEHNLKQTYSFLRKRPTSVTLKGRPGVGRDKSPPPSAIHGGQYDAKYVALGQTLQAAFVADKTSLSLNLVVYEKKHTLKSLGVKQNCYPSVLPSLATDVHDWA